MDGVVGADAGLLEKEFTGRVTSLHSKFGQIDKTVFFDFTSVVGVKPVNGSEVVVRAHRLNADAGWVATRVAVVEAELQWGEGFFQLESTRRVIIGRVTHARGLTGTVDRTYHFQQAALSEGYAPCIDDWLRCHLHGNSDRWTVERVEPVRQRQYSGSITSMHPRMINDDIAFMMWSCIHPYRPQVGDVVEGEAIEHDGRQACWRALNVQPASSGDSGSSMVPATLLKAIQSCQPASSASSISVSIANSIDLGSVEVGSCSRHKVAISNIGTKPIKLKSVVMLWPDHMLDIVSHDDTALAGGEEMCLELELTARTSGGFQQTLVFDFGDKCISRPLAYRVLEVGEGLLAPSAPYQKPVRRQDLTMRSSRDDRVVIPGRRLARESVVMKYLPCKLGVYSLPDSIRQCCYNDGDILEVAPELSQELSPQNFRHRFAALLFIEEVQNEMDMQQFDMFKVRLTRRGPYLALDVPGLAEGRPSLLLGDCISASVSGSGKDAPIYDGYIHEINVSPEKQCILLKFSEDFHDAFDDSDYDVTFSISRTQFRRCHLAVELGTEICDTVLFPTLLVSNLPLANLPKDGLFNKSLNGRQVAAVSRILGGQGRPCPYLLFGPPGTGKTVTLVECILQVFHRLPSSRILACTPSNSAADLLALRLHQSGRVTTADMIRFNAFQRGTPVPGDLDAYSKNVESVEQAARFRLVISTCMTAGMLYSQGLQLGHFSHVFVDEAGQATEPECLIALGLAANRSGAAVSVLAGDPYQLGPVLRSPLVCEYGLQLSLLERLIHRPMYQRNEEKFADHGCYDPLVVTKLVHNYRCHPSILELFSRIFYHNELLACSDEVERNRFTNWSELPNASIPIIFHGVEGNDMREGTSPSWFNPAEILRVADYLKVLFKAPQFQLRTEEVGVITPYRKQVEKMRHFLKDISLEDVKIGSVEEFQGQERPVVIISTVRSQQSLLQFDREHQIGFLSNPKRFNVSVSRAKSLMIIVGNPHILAVDPFWRLLLTYCVRNGAYRGCDLPALDMDSSLLATAGD